MRTGQETLADHPRLVYLPIRVGGKRRGFFLLKGIFARNQKRERIRFRRPIPDTHFGAF